MGELIQQPVPVATLVKRFTELQAFSFSGFDTVGQCKDAMRELERGNFNLATQLVDAMTRDDRVDGALSLRTQGVDSLPLVFKEGAGPKGADAAGKLGERWTKMYPKAAVQELRRWGHMLGLGVAENRWVYDEESKQIEPRLHTWHPRWIWWNPATYTFWMSTMQGVVELTPNTGQWVLYAPHGLYRAWAHGLIRSLYVPWLLRQWCLRDSGRYGEAYGSITKKARFPSALKDEDRDDFLHDVAALGSESVIALPNSPNNDGKQMYDVEFLEAEGTGGDFFERMIQLGGTNIAIRIVGNNLTSEVKGGSYSASVVHDNIRHDLLEDDTDSLATCLKEQSVDFWSLYNYGDKASAPTPQWDCAPPADKKAEGEGLEALGDGLKALALAGIPVDAQKVMEKYGVPLREDATDDEKRKPRVIDWNLVKLGVPLVNEAREVFGWAATEGGDELPKVNPDPKPAPGEESDADPADKKKPPKKGEKKMKSDDPVDPPTTPLEAQTTVDALTEAALKATHDARVDELGWLVSAIEHATDYEDLKAKLTVVYAKMSDKSFETVLAKAMVLADYVGRDFGKTEK